MKIIGVTGGSGVGKTLVLRMLEQRGVYAIDADTVYHALLESDRSLQKELATRFPGIQTEDGIDRKKLGNIVFADAQALEALNRITHKHVMKKLRALLKDAALRGAKAAAVDAAALFESGFDRECDFTIGVTARASLRVRRVLSRDGLDEAYVTSRIKAQKDDDFYRTHCTYFVENNDDIESLEKNIVQILEKSKVLEEPRK